MYKCVDLIPNVFGKNFETPFFEGTSGLCKSIVVQRGGKHCMVIRWVRVYDFSCGRHK